MRRYQRSTLLFASALVAAPITGFSVGARRRQRVQPRSHLNAAFVESDAVLSGFQSQNVADVINYYQEQSSELLTNSQLDADKISEGKTLDPVAKPVTKPPLSTWMKRLNTKEDKKYMHKLSCASFVMSGFSILGTGIFGSSSGVFHDIPEYLQLPIFVFTISSFLQGMSSMEMAKSHRKNDPGARQGFTRSAFSVIMLGVLALWGSPFCPEIFNHQFASEAVFFPLTLLSVINIDAEDKDWLGISVALESRKKTKIRGQQDELESIQETLAYLIPMLVPLFACMVTILVVGSVAMAGEIPRQVFLDHSNEAMLGTHFYSTVALSMCAGFGNLLVTLRDKRLIRKNVEAGLMTPLNLVSAFAVFQITVPNMMEIFSPSI